MKLTRMQLRRLIQEVVTDNKISNFFINKDGDAYIHDPKEGE